MMRGEFFDSTSAALPCVTLPGSRLLTVHGGSYFLIPGVNNLRRARTVPLQPQTIPSALGALYDVQPYTNTLLATACTSVPVNATREPTNLPRSLVDLQSVQSWAIRPCPKKIGSTAKNR